MPYKILFALICSLGMIVGCIPVVEEVFDDGPSTSKSAKAKNTAPTSLNNDDYFEAHHEDGRIYVFDDGHTYKDFLQFGETPYRRTRIGAGPQGQTVVFGLHKNDKKKLGDVAAVTLYEGKLAGAEQGFYAEILHDNRFYVFNNWQDVQSFRKTGEAALRYTQIGAGPGGRTVIYVLNSSNKKQKPTALIAAFNTFHNQK